MLKHSRTTLIALLVVTAGLARAQEKDPLGDIAPAEGNSGQPSAVRPPIDTGNGGPSAVPGAVSGEEQVEKVLDDEAVKADLKAAPKKTREEKAGDNVKVESITDLANLAPFDDVAVIQRRFLPKTGRFELSATGFSNLNNPFYNALGASLRAAYYFREQFAIDLLGAGFGSMARGATDDLKTNRAITTSNVITSKAFGIVSVKWNPIYGKITLFNRTIVPFDLNFNVGGGVTQTTEGENAPTLHLGTSQVFALSKWMALRWDVMWNLYTANGRDELQREISLSQNDLFLGLGVSLYFPEAKYR